MLTPFPVVDNRETLERPFDFSKFPNLQEVNLGFKVTQIGGVLPWIALALSTLRPTTSPRLSAIRLDLVVSSIANGFLETLINNASDDLQRIADEVARIEREFEGRVNLTALRESVFGVAVDTINVSFRSWGGRGLVVALIHPHSPLPDTSGPRPLKLGGRLPRSSISWIIRSSVSPTHTEGPKRSPSSQVLEREIGPEVLCASNGRRQMYYVSGCFLLRLTDVIHSCIVITRPNAL